MWSCQIITRLVAGPAAYCLQKVQCCLLTICIVAMVILSPSSVLAKDNPAPLVLVTIKPLHSLVSAIMKDVGAPYLLLKGSSSPHSFQLKPSAARQINRADLIIRVGANLEVPLNKTFSSLNHPETIMNMIELDGLRLYPLRGRNSRAYNKAHDHGAVDSHARNPQLTDPHLWLDFENAKVMTIAIAARLQKIDPENGDSYKKNAALMIDKLNQYISDFDTSLKPLAGRGFMAFHDAYQYLTRPYDFRFLGALRLHPSRPPSALHLRELRQDMVKLKVSCVFSEPQFNNRVVNALIQNTSIKSTTLDPIGVGIKAGEDAYFLLMKQLSIQMLSCIGPS